MSDETPQPPTDLPPSTPIDPPPPTPTDLPTDPMPSMPPAAAAGPGSIVPPPTAPMETVSGGKGKRTLALVVAALVVLGGGGAAFAFYELRGSSDSLMSQIPAGADLVATVYLNPAASQKVNLFRMTDKFPVLGSESDLTQRLNTLLDQTGQSTGSGLNHNDVQWIGSQAAVVVDFPGAATPNVEVLVNVDDVGAAKATLAKVRANPSLGAWADTQYKGVTVSSSSNSGSGSYAFVGNTLVLGSTSTGVDSIIDTDQGGPSLADSADLKATSDGLPDGRLAFVYVNVKSLLPIVTSLVPGGSGALGASTAGLDAIRGIGMTISAESNGFAMDINESLDPSKLTDAQKASAGTPHENTLTSYVPSNAFGLLQMEHLDTLVNATITQLEATNPDIAPQLANAGISGSDGLISALTGDLTLELAPGGAATPVSGALIVGINDPAKFAAAVTKVKDLVGATQSCSISSSIPLGIGAGQSGTAFATSTGPDCTTTPAPKWQTEDYKGTTINFVADSGGPGIAYAAVDGAGFIGLGPDSIKAVIDAKAGSNISSNADFTAAQATVPTQSEFMYVDLQAILQAAQASAPNPALSQAASVLKPIKAIVLGGEATADHSHTRFMILIP